MICATQFHSELFRCNVVVVNCDALVFSIIRSNPPVYINPSSFATSIVISPIRDQIRQHVHRRRPEPSADRLRGRREPEERAPRQYILATTS